MRFVFVRGGTALISVRSFPSGLSNPILILTPSLACMAEEGGRRVCEA